MILSEFSLSNAGIYGKMDQLTRKENMGLLRSHKVKIIVVTDHAASGLYIPLAGSGYVFSLIKMEETMFISKISLYIGRKLSID